MQDSLVDQVAERDERRRSVYVPRGSPLELSNMDGETNNVCNERERGTTDPPRRNLNFPNIENVQRNAGDPNRNLNLSMSERQCDSVSQPQLVNLDRRSVETERRLQQQAEQLRNLDEVCERLARMHT